MYKKDSSLMGFGWFWVVTEGRKETAPWTRKFSFSVKVNIYLNPCIYLKSENVNIENERAAGKMFWIFEFLHFKMGKWTKNELNTSHRKTSPDIKNILTSPKTQYSKIPTPPPNLSGGAHYVWVSVADFNQLIFCQGGL